MRGFMLRAVPVCAVVFACGCFLTGGGHSTTGRIVSGGPTEVYWTHVGGALAEKPAGQDFAAMVNLVRVQTDRLRQEPTEGVDADLVAAVAAVIKAEDEVLRRAEMADNDPARLKASKDLAKAFADANRAAAEAKKRLRALQPTLKARHGGDFAPIGG